MIELNLLHELKVPSERSALRIMEGLVHQLKDELNLTESQEINMIVALSEAVNNAIQHGNHNDPQKIITIACFLSEDKLIITVEDEGQGFDPTSVPDPTDPLHVTKTTGRGIFLMRHTADEVEFVEGGRKVILGFHL